MVDALSSGPPVAAEHMQVLQRLRQLTAWQQAQQERLRAHQQEQLARLRGCDEVSTRLQMGEPPRLVGQPRGASAGVSVSPEQGWSKEKEEEGEVGSVCDSGLGTGVRDSEEEERTPDLSPSPGGDRPIHPGVGGFSEVETINLLCGCVQAKGIHLKTCWRGS